MSSTPPPEQLLIRVLMGAAQKVLRALASRGPNSASYRQCARELEFAFKPLWARMPSLDFVHDGHALLWNGLPVLTSEDDEQGMLPTLAASGVHAFTMMPGAERGEVVRFLELIDRKRRLDEDGDQDLVLLLFRADLHHIRYTVGPALLGAQSKELPSDQAAPDPSIAASADTAPVDHDEPLPRGSNSGLPRPDPETVRRLIQEQLRTAAPARHTAGAGDLPTRPFLLDEEEITYLRDEVHHEYTRDHSRSVLALLLDTLQLRPEPEIRREVIGVLQRLLPYLMGSGRFGSVAYLTAELRAISRDPSLDDRQKADVDALRVGISHAEALTQLFHVLEDGSVDLTADELVGLLREMRSEAVASVMVWMGTLTRAEAKSTLVQALDGFFRQAPHALATMTASPDRNVAQRALGIAARLQLPEFVDAAGLALDAEAPSTRRAAVAALSAMGGAPAMKRIAGALLDPNAEVRRIACEALTLRPYRGALKSLRASLESPDLEDRDVAERRALFHAFASVAGPAGVSTLEPVLQGRGALARRPSSATRACAAEALGMINSPAARFALEAVAGDRDPLVRNAAGKALRGEAIR